MQACNNVFELIIRLNIEIFLKKMCLNLIMESNVLNLRNCSVFKFYPIITTYFHNFNLDASYIYIKSSLFFFCMVNLEMYCFFFFFFWESRNVLVDCKQYRKSKEKHIRKSNFMMVDRIINHRFCPCSTKLFPNNFVKKITWDGMNSNI